MYYNSINKFLKDVEEVGAERGLSFGAVVKRLLTAYGINQLELAEQIRVNRVWVNKICNDKARPGNMLKKQILIYFVLSHSLTIEDVESILDRGMITRNLGGNK